MKGLIIRKPWVDFILDGAFGCGPLKTWELRGKRTQVRGTIGLIEAGSGLVVGTVDLVDVVGPLSRETLERNRDRHQFEVDDITYAKTYAWILAGAARLDPPVEYNHPRGARSWVRLDSESLSPAGQRVLNPHGRSHGRPPGRGRVCLTTQRPTGTECE